MKSIYLNLSSSAFLLASLAIVYLTQGKENYTYNPTLEQWLSLIVFPLASIILSMVSMKTPGSKKTAPMLIFLVSLLPIALFLAIAFLNHCGFYTGQCR